jgi:hypothetical protein
MMSRFLIWENSYVEGFCVLTGLKGFNQPWLLAKGVALANNWPSDATFSMSPDYPTDMKLSDQVFGGSYRVVSIRLKEALSSIDESSNIEFLPVSILNHKGRLASKDYFIMNPLDSIDCINQDESGVIWNKIDTSMISSCEKLVLKEDAIPEGSVMFREKFMRNTILIRRDIADKLLSTEMSGLFFLEPSQYTG